MLDKFVTRTSLSEKKKLDIQIARFIYATNSAFRHVEHAEFIKMIQLLRPGYSPPSRRQIGNELLEEIYTSTDTSIKKHLRGKTVCMAQDGWSNCHNDAIICVSVTDLLDENVHLVETIDTADNSHTSEYLLNIAIQSIKKCQQFGCSVRSFVTDNASNMTKMRTQLSKVEDIGMPDVITYGCSAHILNLLAHDIEIRGIKEEVKQVIKYFRNNHFASAKYRQAGGNLLILPQDVRWNTLADCLESYLNNWHILSKICTDHRAAIDTNVASKVHDINLKLKAQDYLRKLKKIAVALDRIQKDTCTISEATEIWINLQREFEGEGFTDADIHQCERRMDMAMTPYHYLANLLDHRFRGEKLNPNQLEMAMEYVHLYHPEALAIIINYQAKTFPFKEYLFTIHSVENVKPIAWWMALKNNLNNATLNLVVQLHTAVASSAGIERLFSSFGIVHSKLRNRLGTDKASKLVSIFKTLNKNIPSLEDADNL